jgi:hypothetical protein
VRKHPALWDRELQEADFGTDFLKKLFAAGHEFGTLFMNGLSIILFSGSITRMVKSKSCLSICGI